MTKIQEISVLLFREATSHSVDTMYRLVVLLCALLATGSATRIITNNKGLPSSLPYQKTGRAFAFAFDPSMTNKKAKILAGFPFVVSRGGGCDSSPVLYFKVALSALFEAAALLGTISLGKTAATCSSLKIPQVHGLPATVWVALFSTIFASSFFGSFVDGGLSAATNQLLDPNVVPGEANWYSSLQKPWWEPPGWVFPIMWLVVSKPTQIAAVARLLKTKGDSTPWRELAVYCAHLSLGDAWNKVFFGFQCPGRGAAVITTFFGLLLTSAWLFASVDELAGKLMLPTCAWVFVATALNWSIYLKNKS